MLNVLLLRPGRRSTTSNWTLQDSISPLSPMSGVIVMVAWIFLAALTAGLSAQSV